MAGVARAKSEEIARFPWAKEENQKEEEKEGAEVANSDSQPHNFRTWQFGFQFSDVATGSNFNRIRRLVLDIQ